LAGIEGLADIALLENEGGLMPEMSEILKIPGGEIVDAEHAIALGDEAIRKMRAEKAGSAGYEDAGLQVASAPNFVLS
jgi:hypothetical protein